MEQSDEIVASPSTFNLAENRTGAIEEDDDGDLTFVSTAFTSSKFLIDTEFELDENDDFQPTSYVSLASQFE